MLAKESANYGCPFVDAAATANPTTQQGAAQYNRHAEDTAQMTRTAPRIMVSFATSSGANGSQPVVDSCSVWGEGNSFAPTIAKTGTGIYTITYMTEYDDALVGTTGNEAVAETEQVSFRFGWGAIYGSTFVGHPPQMAFVDNVITVYLFNSVGSASDFGGGVVVQVFAR